MNTYNNLSRSCMIASPLLVIGLLMLKGLATYAMSLTNVREDSYPPPTPQVTPNSPSWVAYLYLPLVYTPLVVEIEVPPCRWPHVEGEFTGISYQWGDRLQIPGSLWRNAFDAAISDWSNAPTKLYFYFTSNGQTIFNTYSIDDGRSGFTQIICSGQSTIGTNVYGNALYDPGNENKYHAIAGHEAGHGQSIGHIYSSDVALMGYNPDPNIYYTPQQIDIDLVNQIYP